MLHSINKEENKKYTFITKSNWTDKIPSITLFTNSTTLHLQQIRETISNFDVVLAKLDAATQEDYFRTNRPHSQAPDISTIINNLTLLSREMGSNQLVLQCLIYSSYREDFIPNSNEDNLRSLAKAIDKIGPKRVQIYSIGRIPAEYYVYSIDMRIKNKISTIFNELIEDKSIEINYF